MGLSWLGPSVRALVSARIIENVTHLGLPSI